VSLFSDYLWAFEITAVLLVIAVVGAVGLVRRRGGGSPAATDAAGSQERPGGSVGMTTEGTPRGR
jgi:hypothetical protein